MTTRATRYSMPPSVVYICNGQHLPRTVIAEVDYLAACRAVVELAERLQMIEALRWPSENVQLSSHYRFAKALKARYKEEGTP